MLLLVYVTWSLATYYNWGANQYVKSTSHSKFFKILFYSFVWIRRLKQLLLSWFQGLVHDIFHVVVDMLLLSYINEFICYSQLIATDKIF